MYNPYFEKNAPKNTGKVLIKAIGNTVMIKKLSKENNHKLLETDDARLFARTNLGLLQVVKK